MDVMQGQLNQMESAKNINKKQKINTDKIPLITIITKNSGLNVSLNDNY